MSGGIYSKFKWSKDKEDQLIELYPIKTLGELSKILNISKYLIRRKSKELKLKTNMNLTIQQKIKEIEALKLQTTNIRELRRLENIKLKYQHYEYKNNDPIYKTSSWDGICSKCENVDIPLYNITHGFYLCNLCDKNNKKLYYLQNSEKIKKWNNIPKYNLNTRISSYKYRDKNNNWSICDYTSEELEQVLNTPCFYCGFLEDPMSLDRLNLLEGHTKSNTVSCCVDCNTARSDNFSVEEMKYIGQAIAEIKKNRGSI